MTVASIEQALLGRLYSMGLQHVLRQTPDGWLLVSPDEGERPVLLDLEKEFRQWKRTLTSFRDQPLYRALGVKGTDYPCVLDATCGLAGDSLQLLAYGCRVHSWERHPVPALMLLRAYEAWQHAVKSEWTLDLETFVIPAEASIIYFDPMYSEVSKKALPRKEMRIFREVVGQDADAVEVAERLRAQKKRLIIKRPPKSGELLPGVAFAQEGKAVRFDVYLP